jgi:hypothetical protein
VASPADTTRHPLDPCAGVVTLSGRHRLPADLVGEVMEVLAEQPRVVVCDLGGMGASPRCVTEVFAPVAPYLVSWPGTVVVACVPGSADSNGCALPAAVFDRLVLCEHCQDGLDEAYRLLRPLQHTMTYLAPVPSAAGEARAFTAATLQDWGLPSLRGPASLVVSELVTDSLLNARTVLGLALSRCEDRVRIAVHDHAGRRPSLPAGELSVATTEGSGMLLVQKLTRHWGVFPDRAHGKTAWAVMDAA